MIVAYSLLIKSRPSMIVAIYNQTRVSLSVRLTLALHILHLFEKTTTTTTTTKKPNKQYNAEF